MKENAVVKGKIEGEGFFSMNQGSEKRNNLSTRLLSCVVLLSCFSLFIPQVTFAQDYDLSLVSSYGASELNIPIDTVNSTDGNIFFTGYDVDINAGDNYFITQDTVLVHANPDDMHGTIVTIDGKLYSKEGASSLTYYAKQYSIAFEELVLKQDVGNLDGTESFSFIDLGTQNTHPDVHTTVQLYGNVTTVGQNDDGVGQKYGYELELVEVQERHTFRTYGYDFQAQTIEAQTRDKILKIDTTSTTNKVGDVTLEAVRGATSSSKLGVDIKANDVTIKDDAVDYVGHMKVIGYDVTNGGIIDTALLKVKDVITSNALPIGDSSYGQFYAIDVEATKAITTFDTRGKNIYFGGELTGGSAKNDIVIDVVHTVTELGDASVLGDIYDTDTLIVDADEITLDSDITVEGSTSATRSVNSVDYTGSLILASNKILLQGESMFETKEGHIQTFGTIDSVSASNPQGLKIDALTIDSRSNTDDGNVYIRSNVGVTNPLKYLSIGQQGQTKEIVFESSTGLEVETKGSFEMADKSEWGQYYDATSEVVLGADMTLSTNGKNVYINKVVSQTSANKKDLTIDTSLSEGISGDIVVDGLWGVTATKGALDTVALTADEVIFGQDQSVVGITSSGTQTYDADVMIEENTELSASSITFNEDVKGDSKLAIIDTSVTFNEEIEEISQLIIDSDTTKTVTINDDIDDVGTIIISSNGTLTGLAGASSSIGESDGEFLEVTTTNANSGQLYGAVDLTGDVGFYSNGGDIKLQGAVTQSKADETKLVFDTSASSGSGDLTGNFNITGSSVDGEELNVEMYIGSGRVNVLDNLGSIRVEQQEADSNLRVSTVNTDSVVDLDGDTETTDDVYGQYYDIEIGIGGSAGTFTSLGKDISFLNGINGNSLDVSVDTTEVNETGDKLTIQGGVTDVGSLALTASEICLGGSVTVGGGLAATTDKLVLIQDTSIESTGGDIDLEAPIESQNTENMFGLKVKTNAGSEIALGGDIGGNEAVLSYFIAEDVNSDVATGSGDREIHTGGSTEFLSRNWGQYYGGGLNSNGMVKLNSEGENIYLRLFQQGADSGLPSIEIEAGDGDVYFEGVFGSATPADSVNSVYVASANLVHFGLNELTLDVHTELNQIYDADVQVNKDTTLYPGGEVEFNGEVSGEGSLTIDSASEAIFSEEITGLGALKIKATTNDVLRVKDNVTVGSIIVTDTGLVGGNRGAQTVIGNEEEAVTVQSNDETAATQIYSDILAVGDVSFIIDEERAEDITVLGSILGETDTVVGVDANNDGDYDDEGDIKPVAEKYESVSFKGLNTGTDLFMRNGVGYTTTGRLREFTAEVGGQIVLGTGSTWSLTTEGNQTYTGDVIINNNVILDATVGDGAAITVNGTVQNGINSNALTLLPDSGDSSQVRFLDQIGTETSSLAALIVGTPGDSLVAIFDGDVYADKISVYGDAMFNGKLIYNILNVSGVTNEDLEFNGLKGPFFNQDRNLILAGDVITSGQTTIGVDTFSQQYGVRYDESNNAIPNSYTVLVKDDILLEATSTAPIIIQGTFDGYLEDEKGGVTVEANVVELEANIGATVPLDYLVVDSSNIGLGTELTLHVDGTFTDDNGTELDDSDDYDYAMLFNSNLAIQFDEMDATVDNELFLSADRGAIIFDVPVTSFNASQIFNIDAKDTVFTSGINITTSGTDRFGLSLISNRADSSLFLADGVNLAVGVIDGFKDIYVNDNTRLILNRADLVGNRVYKVTDPDTQQLAKSSWTYMYLGQSDYTAKLNAGISGRLQAGTQTHPELTIYQGQAEGSIYMAGDAHITLNEGASLKGNIFVTGTGTTNKIELNKDTELNGVLGTDQTSLEELELIEGTTASRFTIKAGDFNVENVHVVDNSVDSTIALRGHFEMDSKLTGWGGESVEIGGEQIDGSFVTSSVVIQNTATNTEVLDSVVIKERSRLTIEDATKFQSLTWGIEEDSVLNLFDFSTFDEVIEVNGGGNLNLFNKKGTDEIDNDSDGEVDELDEQMSLRWTQDVGEEITPLDPDDEVTYEALQSLSVRGGGTLELADGVNLFTRKFIIDANTVIGVGASDVFGVVSQEDQHGIWDLGDNVLFVQSGAVELVADNCLDLELATVSDVSGIGGMAVISTGKISLGSTFGLNIAISDFDEKIFEGTIIDNGDISYGTDEYVADNIQLPTVDLGALWDIQLSWGDLVDNNDQVIAENTRIDVDIEQNSLSSVVDSPQLEGVAMAVDRFHEEFHDGEISEDVNPIMYRVIEGVYETTGISRERVEKVVQQLEPSLSVESLTAVVKAGSQVTPVVFSEGKKTVGLTKLTSSLPTSKTVVKKTVSKSIISTLSPEQAFSFLNTLSHDEMQKVVKEYRSQVKVTSRTERLLHNIDPWGQVLAKSARKKGGFAYESEFDGIALGFNYGAGNKFSWGVFGSYLSGSVEENFSFVQSNKSNIESARFGVYATYIPRGKWMIQGNLGISFDDYDTIRYIDLSDDQEAVRASFSGKQLFAGLKFSKEYMKNRFKIAPFLSANGVLLSRDAYTEQGYTEHGSRSNFLSIKSIDDLVLDFSIGADVESPRIKLIRLLDMNVTGGLAGVFYVGNDFTLPVSITGGKDASFDVEIDNDSFLLQYRLGVNLLYGGCMNQMKKETGQHEPFRVSFDYQGDYGKDYSAHLGSLSIHLSF